MAGRGDCAISVSVDVFNPGQVHGVTVCANLAGQQAAFTDDHMTMKLPLAKARIGRNPVTGIETIRGAFRVNRSRQPANESSVIKWNEGGVLHKVERASPSYTCKRLTSGK